jgi:hypothetical protein
MDFLRGRLFHRAIPKSASYDAKNRSVFYRAFITRGQVVNRELARLRARIIASIQSSEFARHVNYHNVLIRMRECPMTLTRR